MNFGLVEKGGQFGNRRKLYLSTGKGRAWCEELRIPVYRYKSGIEHEACLQAVTRNVLQASPKIVSCKGFSVEGVQPDRVLGLPNGGKLAIQVCCSRNDQREAENLMRLSHTEGIDMVVLCGKDKTHTDAVRRAVSRKCKGQMPQNLIFVSAEQCISNEVDWKTHLSGFGL